MTENPDPPKPATTEQQIRAVLERARSGDSSALPAMQQALDDHPEIWEQYGALTTHVHRSWIELIGGTDLVLKDSLTRQLDSMRTKLSGSAPSPLESLLVERILACWLQSSYADSSSARPHGLSLKQLKFATKRQETAHRGYLSAIANLAMTRKLLAETPERSSRRAGAVAAGSRSVDQAAKREPMSHDVVTVFVPSHDQLSRNKKRSRSAKES